MDDSCFAFDPIGFIAAYLGNISQKPVWLGVCKLVILDLIIDVYNHVIAVDSCEMLISGILKMLVFGLLYNAFVFIL